MSYNLAIIGGGPAGYVAAEKAAKAGLSVILFEKNSLGGVCLNEGCIPTKAFLHSAKIYEHSLDAVKYGVSASDVSFDMSKIVARKNKIIRKLNAGIRSRLKDAGVTVVSAEAYIRHKTEVFNILAGDEEYKAYNIILATGSSVFVPYLPGIETAEIWSSADALNTKDIPAKLIIIGAGVIGMEFASFFNSMGSKVVVIEMLDEILGGMDSDISTTLREEYAKRGIEFRLATKVIEIEKHRVKTSDGEYDFDKLLIATGRKPNIAGFGLENLNPEFENNRIKINDRMQTSVPGLYACGDVTGFSMLAHTAEREGEVAVNNILGNDDRMRYDAVPSVVYTNPEVASVGYSEQYLKDNNIDYTVKKRPMTYAGRFVVENENQTGICKVLISKDDKILGVHIAGNPASELIIAPTMAITHSIPAGEWIMTVFPHPTVGEILKECL